MKFMYANSHKTPGTNRGVEGYGLDITVMMGMTLLFPKTLSHCEYGREKELLCKWATGDRCHRGELDFTQVRENRRQ